MTDVGTHAGHQNDSATTLRDHVPGGFASGEESAMNVDVVQALYPVEGVAGET